MVKIGTWNICLGLKSKKDYVRTIISEEKLDICCVQECEIKPDFPIGLLTFKDYNIEAETNSVKSRCCTFIKRDINYMRRRDLEGEDNNLVIIEVGDAHKYLVINLYRSFSKQHNVSFIDRFHAQLKLIKQTIDKHPYHQTVIMGDFNLNYSLNHKTSYNYKSFFEKLNEVFTPLNLKQIVNFSTWSRVINNQLKESILDHIYINDVTLIKNLESISPEVGDHRLVMCTIISDPPVVKSVIKRNWRLYNDSILIQKLKDQNFTSQTDDVQQFWNQMEYKLI